MSKYGPEPPGGYPLSDIPFRYGETVYRLEEFDEKTMDEIHKCLARKNFYSEKETAEEHLELLESMSKKLSRILHSEEKEGLPNLELKGDIEKINVLCQRLNILISRF